jgi:TRAP-type mannitol/chloroaromatic compound transport system permease small subunit
MSVENSQASKRGDLWLPLCGAQIVLIFALYGMLFKDWWAAVIIGALLFASLLPRLAVLPIALGLAFVFGFFYPHWFIAGSVGVALVIIYFLRPMTVPFIFSLGLMWGLFGSVIGVYLENDLITLICGLFGLLFSGWFNFRLAGDRRIEESVKPINIISEKVGFYCSFLALPMIGVVVYEVFMRKALNMPTTWAFDMTNYIYGAHFMMGLGYCMLYDRHVRIDIIAQQFPSKVQMWLKVITFWILFVPYVLALTYGSADFAIEAWEMWERGQNTWRPPVYLVKSVMPFATAILLFQGFSNFVNDWKQLRSAK